MDAVLDTAIFFGKFFYHFLESITYKIIPKRKKDVSGEIVLITGAGSGIGRQLAINFARRGVTLVLWDINQENNMETYRLAKEKGCVEVFAYKCDCSNKTDIYRVADQVKGEVGNVTILINNAGVVTGKYFLQIPDHMVERSFLVNVLSHFWTCKAFLPAMIEANHGHLVCISSAAGMSGICGLTDYCSSKFAALGFAESLYYELILEKKLNIKTTIVCPYFIKTGMFSGCITKYPFLLPMMEQSYVVEEIVNAILKEELYLVLPKFLSFTLLVKQFLSPKMTLDLAEYLGMDTSMKDFCSREANEVEIEDEKKLL
ncbi:short-chain dehydrogenase/reductase family 16C member 6-like [Erinaceus europaeus]|uniref:Short-chain dehydrogenase/reductase family 16C member 6-like n=1 Tax=Erinaceus europaeus TaxID=9365 RepID=A0A1S3A9N8_ERIEU|nr:short-chain dehydrogenase/reductase family 16C member 6-like [Erinaceus europaeus]